jgi:dienelactone hydrolase
MKLATRILLLAILPSARLVSAQTTDSWHEDGGTPAIVSQELQFRNGDAQLQGTVYLPNGGGPLPGVVVLHDATAGTRDAALYTHLREGLPGLGFAVLIYDRRGSGRSSGNQASADFETLADDAIAGQRALASMSRVDPNRIGFWGLSQGGWLAVLAAGRSPNAAFAISVSAPLVTAEEQMEFATRNLLAIRGYSESDVHDMLEARKAWNSYLHGSSSRETAMEALRSVESKPWFGLAYLPRAAELPPDPEQDPSRRRLDDDAMAAVAKAKVPMLFLFGGADPWVPVAKSMERLQTLEKETHRIEFAVIANANHEMMFEANERMEIKPEAAATRAPQAPAYFLRLGSWLCRQVLSTAPER